MEKLSRIQNQKYLYKNFMQQYFEHGLNGKDDLDTVLETILYEEVPKFRVLTEEIKAMDNKEKEELEELVYQYEGIKKKLIQSLKLNEEDTSKPIELQQVLARIEKLSQDKHRLLYIKGAKELFEKVKTIQREAKILKQLVEDLKANKDNNRKEMIANARKEMKKEDIDSILQSLEIELTNLTQLEENEQQVIKKIKEKSAQIPVENPEFSKINGRLNAILPKDRQKSKLEYQEQISELVYQIRNYRTTRKEKEERADVERRIIKNASIIYNHLERFIVLNRPTNNNYYYIRGVSPEIKEKVQNKFNEMIADGKIKQRESGFSVDHNQYDEMKKNKKWAKEEIYKVLKWLNEVEQEDKIAYYLLWLENKYIRVENEKYDKLEEKHKEQIKIGKVAEKFMEYINKKEEKSSQRDSWNNEKLKRIAPKLAESRVALEHAPCLGEK